jgi:hypothetical protein
MWLVTSPWTRINDRWAKDIDTSPGQPEKDSIIDGHHLQYPPADQDQNVLYRSIALDLVNETVYNYPYPCITEKTLRPIACKRMFIIVGPQGILDLLHSYGFRTFNDIVDESYDTITEPNARFVAVMTAFEEFCNIPLATVQTWMQDNQDIFEHNFTALQQLKQTEFERFKRQFQ